MKHNSSSYQEHGCRCDDCVAAYKAWRQPYMVRRRAQPIPEHLHGTTAGYNRGCREKCCKDANAAYQREWVARKRTQKNPAQP